MINHGEFKSVRSTTNHPETTNQGQQNHDGPAQFAEPSKSETATRRATSPAGDASTLHGPVNRLREIWDAAIDDAWYDRKASSWATADAAHAAYMAELKKQKEATT
jgi:hypothetical protein